MIRLVKVFALLAIFIICITNISCNQASGQTGAEPKFKEYKVILQEVNPMSPNSDQSFQAFETKVKTALGQGWNLVGGAVDLGGYISQTVAK
jgi:hypothetical protein